MLNSFAVDYVACFEQFLHAQLWLSSDVTAVTTGQKYNTNILALRSNNSIICMGKLDLNKGYIPTNLSRNLQSDFIVNR